MNFGMRRATRQDLPVLDKACAQAGHAELGGRLSRWLSEPDVYTYLLEEELPFAFVTVGPGDDLGAHSDAANTGQILCWWVAPDYRGQGHGRKLLVHGQSVLRRRLADSAQIWVSADNQRACQVLIKNGFEDADIEKLLNTSDGVQKVRCFEKNIEEFF